MSTNPTTFSYTMPLSVSVGCGGPILGDEIIVTICLPDSGEQEYGKPNTAYAKDKVFTLQTEGGVLVLPEEFPLDHLLEIRELLRGWGHNVPIQIPG